MGKAARSRPTPGRYPLLARTKSGRMPDFTGWKPVPPRHILARIFHSHFGKSREKPCEKRGANTFECVVEKTRHAGLETCDTAGGEASATTLECRRVSRRMVARFQRLMATVAANPGRCPGLSCCGLSGLLFAASFWMKKAMDLALTERLRGCDTAGWEACATTIGRANPKIAGSRPCGIHARRRAWARLTRRQPPHARARALPETNPGSEWP